MRRAGHAHACTRSARLLCHVSRALLFWAGLHSACAPDLLLFWGGGGGGGEGCFAAGALEALPTTAGQAEQGSSGTAPARA